MTEKDLQNLLDPWWRLNHLYRVVNEDAKEVQFIPNDIQTRMYRDMWYRNVILKHRRPGSTTFWCMVALDAALFHDNYHVVIIAQDIDKAKEIFHDKIRFAYERVPVEIRNARKAKVDRKEEYIFANNSSIRVTTGARSGTVNFLLVTEFGKIAAKRPDIAAEIVTGSFPSVSQDNVIVVESTAEGNAGHFYDLVTEALNHRRSQKPLTKLTFKPQFFAWWMDSKNVLVGPGSESIIIHEKHSEYFRTLKAKHDITLSLAQQRWYVTMHAQQKELMRREFPSTPEEAFEKAVQGAYYANEMLWLREQGRITNVPHQEGLLVDTWWDLDNCTTIIATQTVRNELHVIRYHHDPIGDGLPAAAALLERWAKEHRYVYGMHGAPHDIKAKELGTGKTRIETARALGIKFVTAPRPASLSEQDAIEEVRKLLRLSWFDEAACADLIKGLDAYQREWNEKTATFADHPLHNWASHPADGFRTCASLHPLVTRRRIMQIPENFRQKDSWSYV